MKKMLKSGALLVMAFVLATLASCNKGASSEMLALAGDDATVVAFFNPVEVLKNAGATVEDGNLVLPKSIKRAMDGDAKDLMSLRGIDYESVMAVGYFAKREVGALVTEIKDAEALASSLKKLDYEKDNLAGLPAFVKDDESTFFLVKDNLLIMTDSWSDKEKTADMILDKATSPLAQWKVDAIASCNSATIYGLIVSPEPKVDMAATFAVELKGQTVVAKAECYNLDGKTTSWSEAAGVELETIGSESRYLSKNDMFSFAFGGLKDMSVAKVINLIPELRRQLPRGFDTDQLRALNGGFFMTANMVNPSSRNYENLKNYEFAFGIRTIDDRGERMFKELISMARQFLTVRQGDNDGYVASVPGVGKFGAFFKDDHIVVTGEETPKGSRLGSSALDDCIAWASINIPADFALFKDMGIKLGFKGEGKVGQSTAEGSLEVTGTDKPFLQAIIEAADRVN